jgi:hypothetical protein
LAARLYKENGVDDDDEMTELYMLCKFRRLFQSRIVVIQGAETRNILSQMRICLHEHELLVNHLRTPARTRLERGTSQICSNLEPAWKKYVPDEMVLSPRFLLIVTGSNAVPSSSSR